jgi:hypothetical protein
MRWILPALLALVGLGAGVGAGLLLRPSDTADPKAAPTEAEAGHPADPHAADAGSEGATHAGAPLFDYVKLNNQFVIPVVENSQVVSLVILSLGLETRPGARETVFAIEPKLRNRFLQVLFDHANAGGFRNRFTEAETLDTLRHALLENARLDLGDLVNDVLIMDIVRQDS